MTAANKGKSFVLQIWIYFKSKLKMFAGNYFLISQIKLSDSVDIVNVVIVITLYLHLKRENKVAYKWKTALDQHQSPLNPEKHGWEAYGNGNIKI